MIITEENRPKCVKECGRSALLLMDRMWICGQCYHEYSIKKMKERQRVFLEE